MFLSCVEKMQGDFLEILEIISVREQRYNAQEALERNWKDSGDEEDFDSGENDDESYESASEDKSGEPEMRFHLTKTINYCSTESSDNETSDEGDGRNHVNCVRQRPAKQQQAPLVWLMAHMSTPHDIPSTGSSVVQVQMAGFELHDCLMATTSNLQSA